MARTLTQKVLTLGAGLTLLCSVVACGGRGSVPATPGTTGAASLPAGGSAASSAGERVASAGNAVPTTYQNIEPLAFYTDGSSLSFLITPVSSAQVLTPLNNGKLTTTQFTIPISCTAPGSGVVTLTGDRRSAVAASPTAPPTAAPTNLPVSSCVIVAYANGSTTAIPVSGYGSIDGSTLIFNPLTPGPSYSLGTTYTFYVAYATTAATATPSPTPEPTSSPDGGGGSWCHGWWSDKHGEHHGWYFKHHDGSESNHDDHGCDHNGNHGHEPDDQCADKADNGLHNGNDDTRNEHDSGNHKDCGYHTGDSHDNHGGNGDDGNHH